MAKLTKKMLGHHHNERKSNQNKTIFRWHQIFLYDYTHGQSEAEGRLTTDRLMKE